MNQGLIVCEKRDTLITYEMAPDDNTQNNWVKFEHNIIQRLPIVRPRSIKPLVSEKRSIAKRTRIRSISIELETGIGDPVTAYEKG